MAEPKKAPLGTGAAAMARKKIRDRKKLQEERMKKAMEASKAAYGKPKKKVKKKAKKKRY